MHKKSHLSYNVSESNDKGERKIAVQLPLMVTDKQRNDQRKLLEDLIRMKTRELWEKEFKGFHGTKEEIQRKSGIVDKQVKKFIRRVVQAFPESM